MPVDPIAVTKNIADSYISYLTTTFPIRDPRLAAQFRDALSQPDKLVKGPILEATPPFILGASISGLVREGVLSQEFLRIPESELPADRPLYRHQETAIRKTTSLNRNIVVASGTGSGKTEAFMIPILNYLFRQHEQGVLGPGVRALLLYPMNALANDQMARLRRLLANHPGITFGRYTGETKEDEREAVDSFIQMFGTDPLPNELVSRRAMRESPPNILLTNYAMLEYLLLRPKDTPFFDGAYASSWHFLVLDEAHTFRGAKGIEIGMLLRRLRDRVVDGARGALQCFATSATLGRGIADASDIVGFASEIFGEPFEWVVDDPSRQDVVVAERLVWTEDCGQDTFSPDPALYQSWHRILESGEARVEGLAECGKKHGVPAILLNRSAKTAGGVVDRFLFEVMRNDLNVASLRMRLQDSARMVSDLAVELFPDRGDRHSVLTALVGLAARARPEAESAPLLPARYHLFVRAIEGAYLQVSPEPRITLERTREMTDVDSRTWPVFEAAVCRNCGALYIVGQVKPSDDGQGSVLRQVSVLPGEGSVEYFLLVEQLRRIGVSDEDEEAMYEESQTRDWEQYRLCTSCGRVWRATSLFDSCSCSKEYTVALLRAPDREQVYYCPGCGRRNPSGQVLRFLEGTDASATVIATSLYQSGAVLRGVRTDQCSRSADDGALGRARDTQNEQDGWASDWSTTTEVFARSQVSAEPLRPELPRLLVFSDSRQDAAFFAPYLNRTYSTILSRRVIRAVVEENHQAIVRHRWRLADLVDPVIRKSEEAGLFDSKTSLQGKRTQVWKWLMAEFLQLDRHNSLESLGFLSFSPAKPYRWAPPAALMKEPWNLSEDEIWMLLRGLLDTTRRGGVVAFPDSIDPKDEDFAPRNREYFVRQEVSDAKRGVLAWYPRHLNGRLDYLVRVANRLGLRQPDVVSAEALRRIWSPYFMGSPGRPSIWAEHFIETNLHGLGTVYQLRHDMWELDLPGDDDTGWYRCDACGTIARVNVRGVCPSYLCQGTLRPMEKSAADAGNHYGRLYSSLVPIRLTAEEHTAQLTSEAAAELQTKFSKGEVNVLSCSTTFELGVSLGTLEIVFLRNMPPTPANYVQRAGRAGRRTGSAAFVTTFARRRPHDREFYQDPYKMVAGKIRPPRFSLDNEKIVRRHLCAMALAYLWRRDPESFQRGDVQGFFENDCGPNKLRGILESKPPDLLRSILRTVPPSLHDTLGIRTWDWVRVLFDNESGLIPRAAEEYHHDRDGLEKVLQQLQEQRRRSDHILTALNTVNHRELIGYLASRSVLPKYGFPVDVVELKISHHSAAARRLELDRDLRIALSEYAPGSSVVAGGKLWTSRYLRRLPRRALPRYRYAICQHCGGYHRVQADLDEELSDCPLCHTPFTSRGRGEFLVPEFGFLTEFAPPRDPPSSAPERSYSTRVHLWGRSLKLHESIAVESNIGLIQGFAASKARLAVLNTGRGAGFMTCLDCGYTVGPSELVPRTHLDHHGGTCRGTFRRSFLGHEFETDVLLITFPDHRDGRPEFWLSLLYGLLEGTCLALDIERGDLDGCLYPISGDPRSPALVLFDDVPGGAGHVRRVDNPSVLIDIIHATLSFLSSCDCGSSCSGCLRNFRNQTWHDILDRRMVIEFLERAVIVK